jgi:nucleotide-binding universal stress UspA family protein
MAFKEALLALSSYPEATPVSAIEQAVQLAELLGTRISALTFEIDFRVPVNILGNLVLDIPGMIADERAKSVKNAREIVAVFDALATKRGLLHHHMIERGLTVEIPDIVTEYARVHDLTIVPVDAEPGFQQYLAESVIFGCGRPVLIVPTSPKRDAAVRLDAIGVAWDFSRPAARAIADSLPLLERAKSVRVVTVTNEKTIRTRRSGPELARHLAAHGVNVVLDEEDVADRPIGSALEAYAAAYELDLLVMGAFGHSRVRDFVLGGATKSIVANPPLPVFLSH